MWMRREWWHDEMAGDEGEGVERRVDEKERLTVRDRGVGPWRD